MNEFVTQCLSTSRFQDFEAMHETSSALNIRVHGSLVNETDDAFKSFLNDASIDKIESEVIGEAPLINQKSWQQILDKHGDLLRGIARAFYFQVDKTRRVSLTFCIFFSSAGYILLVIPSFDLFIKVLIATLNIS